MNKQQENNKLSKHLEEVVFSTLLWNFTEEKAVSILSELNRDDFQFYPLVYDTLQDSIQKKTGFSTDMISKGIEISQLINNKSAITEREFNFAVKELKKVSTTIKYISTCEEFIHNVTPREVDESVATLVSKLNSAEINEKDRTTAKEGINEFDRLQKTYQDKFKLGLKFLGTETGFKDFDNTIDGIQQGKLYILGGTPGAGKTSFALNLADNLLTQGKRVVIFSLEMSSLEIMAKIIGQRCNLNFIKILKGNLTDEERATVENKKCELYDQNLVIYDSMIDFDKVKLAIIKENMVSQIDFCVIDYLQLMGSSKYKTEFERMSVFPTELKTYICRKLNIPIMALSQINNESAKNPNDNMSGFKGSGAIEAAADAGFKIMNTESREDRDQKKADSKPWNVELLITKQRAGITKPIQMNFSGKTGRFREGYESGIMYTEKND